MNKSAIIFLFLLLILNIVIVLGTKFIINSIVWYFTISFFAYIDSIVGVILIILGCLIIPYLENINIPPRLHNRHRQYEEERKVIWNFVLWSYLILLLGCTVVLFLMIKIGATVTPYFQEFFQEYYLIVFSGITGALWGVGVTEMMHVGNYIKYGKNYQKNIDWTREIEGRQDWYENIETYDSNLFFWKDKIIKYSVFLCLVFAIILPIIQEVIDNISMI